MFRLMIATAGLIALGAQAQAQTATAPSPSTQPPVMAAPAPTATGMPDTPTPPAKTATSAGMHRTLADRFADANTTHDGHLTRDQAHAAKWTYLTKHFSAIDKDKKGYVTIDDIKSYKPVHTVKHKPTPAPAPAAAPTTNG